MHTFQDWLRKPKLLAAVVAAVVGVGILIYTFVPRSASSAAPSQDEATFETFSTDGQEDVFTPPTPTPAPTAPVAPAVIVVAITGAVNAPDAYTLPPNARLKDLVVAAGGLAAEADADQINLAQRLNDAEKIHVPRQGEASAPAPESVSGTAPAPDEHSDLININTATASELEELNGIGVALAKRIVEYRAAKGPFASVDDLKQVKGISAALLDDIAPYITTGP